MSLSVAEVREAATRRGRALRARRARTLAEPAHDERTAAWLGIALGVGFVTCFVTGLYSHLLQHPVSWLTIPPRPAGLYRVTQGLHVVTGFALVPLVVVKLWVVYPQLFRWPPVATVAQAVERLLLVLLVCGAVFQLVTGTANVARWYPWHFFFPTGHYWVAWITIGALVVHLGAKATVTRRALRRRPPSSPEGPGPGPTRDGGGPSRRTVLTAAAAASGFLVVTTAGQTFPPLRALTLFAQRRPDIGPQGVPVNKAAVEAGVIERATSSDYRLRLSGSVARPLELRLADLQAMTQRRAELPIACVEGWSASAVWEGVPVRDLLAAAGVPSDRHVEVEVRSLERNGLYSVSVLNHLQARDPDTLLALSLAGEPLDLDHGYPCRLIGPNRPGVLQTKWVEELVVR